MTKGKSITRWRPHADVKLYNVTEIETEQLLVLSVHYFIQKDAYVGIVAASTDMKKLEALYDEILSTKDMGPDSLSKVAEHYHIWLPGIDNLESYKEIWVNSEMEFAINTEVTLLK